MTQQTDSLSMQDQPSKLMSPQQAAALLEAAAQGDTDMEATTAEVLDGGAPSAAPAAAPSAPAPAPLTPAAPAPSPAPAAPAPAPAQQTAAVEDPANTVILAKDGKHTIGYDKLVEARTAAATSRAAAEQASAALAEANAKLAAFQAAADARASAGVAPTAADMNAAAASAAIDAGVSPDVFGDWSPEAMAKGVQAVLAHGTKPLLEQMTAMRAELDTLRGASQRSAQQQHYDAIYAAHPDADSVAESSQLQDWLNTKPAFVRPAYQEVLAKGTAQQITELFTAFKTETGRAAPAPAPATAAGAAALKAADDALNAAKNAIPASLSDIPGARGAGSVFEQLDELAANNPAGLIEALTALPEQQRQDYINRNS